MLGKVLAILSILGTAALLLFVTNVTNSAMIQVNAGVQEATKPLTSQVPNGDETIQNAQTWDDLKTLSEDSKNVQKSAAGGFSKTMSFGFPIMIVAAAGLGIARVVLR